MNKKAFLLLCFLWPALSAMAQMDHLVFTPQWLPQAQFAGYYVAQEKGFFKEAGLDVEIVHPTASEPALTRIKEDKSQATTLQLMEAMELCDFGIPLVNILQTSMNNSLVIVSRRGMNPMEQKGARVGVWSAGFGQLAYCMSIKDGLDYEWIPIASNINAGGVELRFPATFTLVSVETTQCTCLESLSAESAPADSNQPALVLRALTEGETLWDVAKQYRTTAEEILAANELTESSLLEAGRMLLIPRSR